MAGLKLDIILRLIRLSSFIHWTTVGWDIRTLEVVVVVVISVYHSSTTNLPWV